MTGRSNNPQRGRCRDENRPEKGEKGKKKVVSYFLMSVRMSIVSPKLSERGPVGAEVLVVDARLHNTA